MSEIRIKKGESKVISFLIKRNGVAYDMSQLNPVPIFKFAVKLQREDTSYLIEKDDTDFNKDDLASGYAKVPITADDLSSMKEGTYMSELKTIITADDIDKSNVIDFVLEKSVIHD